MKLMTRFGTGTEAAARLALSGASNNRWLRAGYAGGKTFLRSLGRVLHLLWLQVTGVFFLLFAVTFATRLPRAYAGYSSGNDPKHHFVLLASVTVMFTWFGVSSFWRARQKQKK